MFEELLARIGRALGHVRLPYMIIGGQAVLLYGVPRMTKDIDITLGTDIGGLEPVLEAVRTIGLSVIPEDFRRFVERTSVLPTIDGKTGIRVDLIFSFTPYEAHAISRAKTVELRGTPVLFASVEDVIIHKVFAGRPRDLEDVRWVVLKNSDLDRAYVRRWLKEFESAPEGSRLLQVFEDVLSSVLPAKA